MHVLTECALATGLVVGFVSLLQLPIRAKLTMVRWPLLLLAIVTAFTLFFLEVESFPAAWKVWWYMAGYLLVMTMVHFKRVQVTIGELDYVSLVSAGLFVLVSYSAWSLPLSAVVSGIAVLVCIPLLRSFTLKKVHRFLYFAGFALLQVALFVTLALQGVVSELVQLDTTIMGVLVGLCMGIAMYRYVLYAAVLIAAFPSRLGHLRQEPLYRRFDTHFSAAHYPVGVLVGGFVLTYAAMYGLSLVSDATLIHVAVVTTAVGVFGHAQQWLRGTA